MIEVRMKNKKRIIIGFMIIAFLMILLCLRTAWIQVVKADDYSETATNQQMSDIPLEAERGSIFDRNGQQMAVSATCYSMWVRPAQITENYDNEEKYTELCQKLAVILDAKAADLRKELKQDSTLVCIARYLDKSQRDKIADLEIPGVELSEGTRRYYPMKTSAAKLLGSVTDDGVGRTGIESEFDKYLSGVSGRWIKATDLNGDTLSYGKQTLHQAKNGYNVHLTVDEVLQHYAEEAAEKGMKDTKASRVMILVMNPKNGDVLAMAATPSFDPNNATAPLSSSDKKAYDKMTDKEQSEYLSQMWSNPLVSNLYEPGSTFKLLTTSAALEEGVTTPGARYYDSGSINVDGTVLHCWNLAGHGAQSLTEAVGNSCNPVQVELALKMGKKKYYNYLEMFGITDTTGIDLPAETSALIKDESGLTNVDLATMAYGQGIAVTPIQLLTAINAIGNDGVMMKPRIVSKLTNSEGKTVRNYPTEKVRKVISSKTADEMRSIMEYVVEKGGGGAAGVPGYRVGGKTGTADKVVNGVYTKDTYSSFVGMAPMDDPRISMLVVVDSPKGNQYGSSTAAPIANTFLTKALTYLEVSPRYTSEEEKALGSSIVYVPKVKGMTYSQAVQELKKAGLKYTVSPKIKKDTTFKIVDQYPAAGSKVTKGDTIYLYRK